MVEGYVSDRPIAAQAKNVTARRTVANARRRATRVDGRLLNEEALHRGLRSGRLPSAIARLALEVKFDGDSVTTCEPVRIA